jgi:hypothetical protein
LRKDHPEQTTIDIQTELLTWVHRNEGDIYNPFLTLDGKQAPDDNPKPSD